MFDTRKPSHRILDVSYRSIRQARSSLVSHSRFLVLFLMMAVLLIPFSTLTSPLNSLAKSHTAVQSRSPHLSLMPTLGQPKSSGLATIYNPYWYLDRKTTATLEITNNAEAPRTLTPVLLLRGLERISLDQVTVASRQTVRVSINHALSSHFDDRRKSTGGQRWGDGSRKRSMWGAALLQGGSTEGVSGWILSENPSESISINSLFDGPSKADLILSAMWWLPTPKTKVLYALHNTFDSELVVNTILYMNGRIVRGRRVTLPAGGSSLVDLRELLPDSSTGKPLSEVGTVRFVANGSAPSLLGRAVLVDTKSGFSVPLMVHGISSHRSNELQMPGTPFGRPDRSMGFPKGTRFTTKLLLTNTSDKSMNVTAALDGKDSTGKPISWDTPVIELAAYESRVVDLERARIRGRAPIADVHVGLRLSHTGSMVDLLAEAVTVDQTLTFSFYDPLFDRATAAPVNHAISFNLTGDKNTLLVIKNTSNQAARFGYTLSYEDGGSGRSYRSPLLELQAYELRVVDIKSLRDRGVADAEGRRLPDKISFGNGSIYSDRPILIAGDPTFDPVAGTCFSCTDPCCPGGICPIFEEGGLGCSGCEIDPSLCGQGQTPQCTTCCSICATTQHLCILAASAAFAVALSACAAGACDAEPDPDRNPECAICLAAAAAGFGIALGICDLLNTNCRQTCSITHTGCSCP